MSLNSTSGISKPSHESKFPGLIIVVNFDQEVEIAHFLNALRKMNPGLDVIVVDDGSRDSSAAIAEQLDFEVIRHGVNRGVGAAIRTGIHHAREKGRYEFVLVMSSNGKMRPDEIPTVIG